MAKNRTRTVLLSLVAIAVLIQFVTIRRDNPPSTGSVTAPSEVMLILRRSCYDCHSSDTNWPWYSHVAPVSWLVARDVHDGRRHLNFSEWSGYAEAASQKKLGDISREVKSGDMPLWYYFPMHPAARMSPDDVRRLAGWAESLSSR